MKNHLRIALLALPLCGCLATTGELDEAIASITEQIDEVAQDAAESSEAVRDAWARGEITAAEMERKLADIRAAAAVLAKEAAREEFGALRDTIVNRPEVVAQAAADAAGTFIPGVPGELLALIGTGLASYLAASRKAKKDAEDAVWDARYERKEEQLAKLEAGKK